MYIRFINQIMCRLFSMRQHDRMSGKEKFTSQNVRHNTIGTLPSFHAVIQDKMNLLVFSYFPFYESISGSS